LRLVIIGDGPLIPELASDASTLGVASKIRLPGAMPEAARYLPAFDVCCLTSHTEGMPNLVMEASAAGVPVVATTCCRKSGVIEPGITGLLVDSDDDDGMVAHVHGLLTRPEDGRRMGHAGRARMRREFSIEAMVERMTRVYQDALTKKLLLKRPLEAANGTF
jgi:glycosyltransferase involved in cell wall biosynthesis